MTFYDPPSERSEICTVLPRVVVVCLIASSTVVVVLITYYWGICTCEWINMTHIDASYILLFVGKISILVQYTRHMHTTTNTQGFCNSARSKHGMEPVTVAHSVYAKRIHSTLTCKIST